MATLSRRYILCYTQGRTWATSEASSFAEALERAKVHGLSPEDFRRGERILDGQVTAVEVDRPLCARRLCDDSAAMALAEHYLGARLSKEVPS
jgi:hypothetical protein